MPASPARSEANRRNSQLSTGPRSAEGKEKSRRNGLKHGLTGAGIVVLEEDAGEVERRKGELQAELAPQSAIGRVMVRRMATLSVRMERSSRREEAAIELRVRHAAEDFDQARLDEADRLLELLGEEPRAHLRKLRGSPEGVERLIEAWQELRSDLTRQPRSKWTAWHLERAANLTGYRVDDAGASELAVLSKATWGDFAAIGGTLKSRAEVDRVEPLDEDDEDVEPVDVGREVCARARLVERIDAEIAALEAHHETLDFRTIELDRAGAPDRALFDPSRDATLARRYESEASRGFYKALKEYRLAEDEAAERTDAGATPESEQNCDALASSWDRDVPLPRDPQPTPDRPRPIGDGASLEPVEGREMRGRTAPGSA
jgi:hypothetical protein